jgi:hypothetical protein
VKDPSVLAEFMLTAPTIHTDKLYGHVLAVIGRKAVLTHNNVVKQPDIFEKAYRLGTSFVRFKLRKLLDATQAPSTNRSFCVPRAEREQAREVLSAVAGDDLSPSEAVSMVEYEAFLEAVSRAYVDAWRSSREARQEAEKGPTLATARAGRLDG